MRTNVLRPVYAVIGVCIAVSLILVGLNAIPVKAEEVFKATWKLHSPYPLTKEDHMRGSLVEFAKLVGDRTNGRLKIEPALGGVLGFKAIDALPVLKKGLVEIQEITCGYIEGTEPLTSVIILPFLLKDFDEALWYLNIFQPYLARIYDKWGGKLLYTEFWPPQHFYTKKPINSLEDFKGLKARSNGPVYSLAHKAIGMTPVSVPWSEIPTALERGMIDVMTSSALSTAQAASWDYMDYTIKTDYCLAWSDVVVSKKAWNQLPDDIKLVVIETAFQMQRKATNGAKASDDECIALLEKNGMKTMTLSPDVKSEAAGKCKPIWDKVAKRAGPEGVELLDKFLALVGRSR